MMLTPGESVEHFEILGSLGKGGMGEVYVARDTRLGRKVAIKTIVRRRDWSAAWKGRFLREARILSSLDHPHICRVLEFLERPDADLLVLEFIEGCTLKQVLKEAAPSDSRAFSIAKQICAALAAAHERGIIHRDVKPDNVMITGSDQVKVLDFGISREQDMDLEPANGILNARVDATPSASMTRTGEMMGTPAYMSPEQARGEGLSTASDLFSLGLTLHELFTGEPAWNVDDTLPELFYKRQSGQVEPVSGLPADLVDLIESMKAFEPGKRPTASECLRQLEWIESKPARRFKTRLQLGAIAVLILVALLLGILSWRLNAEVKRANREAQTAQETSDFIRDLFVFAGPNANYGKEVSAREMLELGTRQLATTLPDDPIARARLLSTVGTVYRLLGDYERATEILEEALSIRERDLGLDDLETAKLWYELGLNSNSHRDPAAAEPYWAKYLAFCQSHLGPNDVRVFGALAAMADVKRDQNMIDDARAYAQQAERIRDSLPEESRQGVLYADGLFNLAADHVADEDFDRAIALLEDAIQVNLHLPQPDVVGRSIYISELARVYFDLSQFDRAFELYRESMDIKVKALGEKHLQTIVDRLRIASLQAKVGRHQQAVALMEAALKDIEEVGATDINIYTSTLVNLSAIYRELGDFERAEVLVKSVLDNPKRIAHLGSQVARIQGNLASIYIELGRYDEAEAIYRDVYPTQQDSLGKAVNRNNLAEICRLTGRLSEAETLYRQGLSHVHAVAGPDHYMAGEIKRGLAESLLRQKKFAEAIGEVNEAYLIQERGLGATHALTLACRILQAELNLATGIPLADGELESLAGSLMKLGPEKRQLTLPVEALAAEVERIGRFDDAQRLRATLIKSSND